MDKELTKLYYSIGEVAEMFDVSQSLLRFWETEFPRLKPGKTRRGDRKYTKKDILYIERIYDLVKLKGYTLEGARKVLKKGGKVKQEDKEILTQKLQNIKQGLQTIIRDLED